MSLLEDVINLADEWERKVDSMRCGAVSRGMLYTYRENARILRELAHSHTNCCPDRDGADADPLAEVEESDYAECTCGHYKDAHPCVIECGCSRP